MNRESHKLLWGLTVALILGLLFSFWIVSGAHDQLGHWFTPKNPDGTVNLAGKYYDCHDCPAPNTGKRATREQFPLLFAPLPVTDLTKPTIPGALTATAISPTQINLKWNTSTDNIGVIGYRVEFCQGVACTNFVQHVQVTIPSYQHLTLSPLTTYRFRTRAVDQAGNLSGYSTIATATTLGSTPPPTPPTVTYTMDFAAMVWAPGSTIVAWTPSGTAPTGTQTEVWWQNGLTQTWIKLATVGFSVRTFTHLYTERGSWFCYKTNAILSGLRGPESEAQCNQMPADPPLLSSATLTWNPNTETDLAGYNVYVGTGSGLYQAPISIGPIVPQYQVKGLTIGKTYWFAVTAKDAANNESAHSNEVSKTIN